MKFFTDAPIEYPYLLIKMSKFNVKKINPFFDYIVDSGVYELRKNGEYNLKKWEKLKTFPHYPNIEFTIPDYPSDLLGDNEKNIEKTFDNIQFFYNNYSNVNLLPVIQFLTLNYKSFIASFKRFIELYPDEKRVGIGNLCRCRHLSFLKRIAYFLQNYKEYSFHIFGLTIKAIPIFKNFEKFSFDGMKWDVRRKKWKLSHCDKITFDGMKWTRPINESGHSAKTKQEKIVYFTKYLERMNELLKFPKITLDNFFEA